MIGLACSLLASASAFLVARRAPRHIPLAIAFTASAAYAGTVEGSVSGRPALLVLSAIAATTSIAFLLAWSAPAWEIKAAGAGAIALAGWILLAPAPASWWTAATWGPYAASCALGLVAWLRRRRAGEQPDITRRVALAVLLGDVLGLLLARWPGVVEWEGRAMALAVTAVHLLWLYPIGRRADA